MRSILFNLVFIMLGAALAGQGRAETMALFLETGPSQTAGLPAHIESARSIRLNRAALNASKMTIELNGQMFTAIRTSFDRSRAGQHIWYGFLQGNPVDTVIITLQGAVASGLIQNGDSIYRIGYGGDRLLKVDLEALPPDEIEPLPDGGGESLPSESATAVDGNVQQDLLVVYTQKACNSAGGCPNLEADITTAVADLNNAYGISEVHITMNLVGTALTSYSETDTSTALNDLRNLNDGQMDEVHGLRDQLGADLVALVQDGSGCGIAYVGSSASSAFSVTDISCLVDNRTLAHELGHNQGALHDRVTSSAGSSTNFNYGYRRCDDATVDQTPSPWFRTIMAYSCNKSPRVGHFSNPTVNYLGVPTGVAPGSEPPSGAYNVLTLNNSASYVAGFRTAPEPVDPPAAPTNLTATATDQTIVLVWTDNAVNETAYRVERSQDNGASWSLIASLPADAQALSDTGLSASTTYTYRVAALNSAGTGYSNTAFDTTGSLPSVSVAYATQDIPGRGTVTGSYEVTRVSDGEVQVITEADAGGPRNRRKQAYTHTWDFNLSSGGAGGVFVGVAAAVTGSEGARFSYSVDNGASWTLMFTVNSQTTTLKSFDLPAGTAGGLLIQVNDSAQSKGETRDSVEVDQISVTSINDVGSVPDAPQLDSDQLTLLNSTEVKVDWTDRSDDEFGFEILRGDQNLDCANDAAVVGTVGADVVSYIDSSPTSGQVHYYLVRAYNAAGSACSAVQGIDVPAPPPGNISVSYRTFKTKGLQKVEIVWSGALVGIDVYRDNAKLELPGTTGDSGSTIDPVDRKGGGSYTYSVCEQGGASCTQPVAVTF